MKTHIHSEKKVPKKPSQKKSAAIQLLDNREKKGSEQLQKMKDNRPQAIQLMAIQQAGKVMQFGRKRSYSKAFGDEVSEHEPPRIKRRLLGVTRLTRAYHRNRRRKSRPKRARAVYERQQRHNYGYDHKDIRFGAVKGSFRKGPFVPQPYLGINKDDYGLKKKPKTNYDDIIKGLELYKDDAGLARIILNKIKSGTELPPDMNGTIKANVSLLIMLTQFIEPHDSRVPGIDKLARSFLRKIARGSLTFKQVFNRKNGLFVVARAKSGKSKYGGQESGRTLVRMPAKKSDRSSFDEIWSPEIDAAADEMSESSEEEEEM